MWVGTLGVNTMLEKHSSWAAMHVDHKGVNQEQATKVLEGLLSLFNSESKRMKSIRDEKSCLSSLRRH